MDINVLCIISKKLSQALNPFLPKPAIISMLRQVSTLTQKLIAFHPIGLKQLKASHQIAILNGSHTESQAAIGNMSTEGEHHFKRNGLPIAPC